MSAALWNAGDAAAATGGAATAGFAATGVSIDTRTLQPGDLFVALAGDARDGHDFVADALARGAAAALVSRRPDRLDRDAPLLIVPDTRAGLEALGRAARARSTARIAAVTGSVGKTGTKEMLRLMLAGAGETHASAASYNNHWGVPLTLARMAPSARFAVFEIGMNHAGEITPLTRMVRPHAAIVTTVEAVHLEHFSGVEGIADAKAEIVLGIEPGGTAIFNRDNPWFARLSEAAVRAGVARVLSFGAHPAADARLLRWDGSAEASDISAEILGTRIDFTIGMPGRHIVQNALGALLTAAELGVAPRDAAPRLAGVRPPAGRGTRTMVAVPGGEALLIDESYNANPASMRAAIALLGAAPVGPRGRRIAVLGDMLELGPDAERLHAELAGPLADAGIDLVFTAGSLMAALDAALPDTRRGGWAAGAAALAETVVAAVKPGDAVMIKGSNGSRTGMIVAALGRGAGAETAATGTGG